MPGHPRNRYLIPRVYPYNRVLAFFLLFGLCVRPSYRSADFLPLPSLLFSQRLCGFPLKSCAARSWLKSATPRTPPSPQRVLPSPKKNLPLVSRKPPTRAVKLAFSR